MASIQSAPSNKDTKTAVVAPVPGAINKGSGKESDSSANSSKSGTPVASPKSDTVAKLPVAQPKAVQSVNASVDKKLPVNASVKSNVPNGAAFSVSVESSKPKSVGKMAPAKGASWADLSEDDDAASCKIAESRKKITEIAQRKKEFLQLLSRKMSEKEAAAQKELDDLTAMMKDDGVDLKKVDSLVQKERVKKNSKTYAGRVKNSLEKEPEEKVAVRKPMMKMKKSFSPKKGLMKPSSQTSCRHKKDCARFDCEYKHPKNRAQKCPAHEKGLACADFMKCSQGKGHNKDHVATCIHDFDHCRYGPKCHNIDDGCEYFHPKKIWCAFDKEDETCGNENCEFEHLFNKPQAVVADDDDQGEGEGDDKEDDDDVRVPEKRGDAESDDDSKTPK